MVTVYRCVISINFGYCYYQPVVTAVSLSPIAPNPGGIQSHDDRDSPIFYSGCPSAVTIAEGSVCM